MTENNQIIPVAKVKKEWIAPALIEEDIDATKSGFVSNIFENPSYHS